MYEKRVYQPHRGGYTNRDGVYDSCLSWHPGALQQRRKHEQRPPWFVGRSLGAILHSIKKTEVPHGPLSFLSKRIFLQLDIPAINIYIYICIDLLSTT